MCRSYLRSISYSVGLQAGVPAPAAHGIRSTHARLDDASAEAALSRCFVEEHGS